MKVLDLFSGIGGFSLGFERVGWQTVAFCEIDKHCQVVLRSHWPEVIIFDDITKLDKSKLSSDIDVICGGFPCQDISVAGHQEGITGSRSNLWKEYKRLINEIRPKYAIIENVANLRNNGLVTVLQDLAEIRYNAEWHCISARNVGAPHRRDRIWIIAYPDGERCQGERELGEVSELFADKIGQAILRDSVSRDTWKKEPVPRIADGKLNPEFVEWMMGYPIGWTESITRIQRIKGLGNSLVPVIPEIIADALSKNI